MHAIQTAIIGAGAAGLACAHYLEQGHRDWVLFEAADRPGGRLRTDREDGFIFDHGFQVFLTAYPEARALLNFEALQLKAFEPGALIFTDGKPSLISDPLRRPAQTLSTLLSRIGTLRDKLRIARWRSEAMRLSIAEIERLEERSSAAELERLGFSEAMQETFLRPFFRGIFLERDLETSCRHMNFVFKMFSEGEAALPRNGIQSIAEQLAAGLPTNRLRFGRTVERLEGNTLHFADGQSVSAEEVVVATDATTAHKWLHALPEADWNSTDCHYFACAEPPVSSAHLCLVPGSRTLINNFCVPSLLHNSHAPAGTHLVSVTCLDRAEPDEVKSALRQVLGAQVDKWEWLRHYRIPQALPVRRPLAPVRIPVQLSETLYVAGDHRDFPSLNGALRTGRLISDAIMSRYAPVAG